MTVYIFALVVGWGFLLNRWVNDARMEAGLKCARSSSFSGMIGFCWVPVISVLGICFPGLFLGGDVVRKLKEQGSHKCWFGRIRMGACAYLVLLLGFPVLLLVASHH